MGFLLLIRGLMCYNVKSIKQERCSEMKREEKILICLSGSPSNARVIRAGAKLAEAFRGSISAVFVEPPDFDSSDEGQMGSLTENLRLAKRLGAHVATLYGDDAATQIAEYARISGATKIVLGRSPIKQGILPRKNIIDRLSELAPDMDIYIIPDRYSAGLRPPHRGLADERFRAADVLKTVLLLALCTLAGFLFVSLGLSSANVMMLYILGVLGVAMYTEGRSYSLAASVLSVLVFNFFFTEPYYSLAASPNYLVAFIVMFAAALFISSLTVRLKRQARQTAQRSYRTDILLETSQKLQKAESEENILSLTAAQLMKLLERDLIVYPAQDGKLKEPMLFPFCGDGSFDDYMGEFERDTALWVLENNRRAGCGTNVRANANGLYMAIRGTGAVLAVVCVAMKGTKSLESLEKSLMLVILDECGLILENENNRRAKREIEEKARAEELRANLLRSISHDLRTPLTSISGTAALLLETDMDEQKRRKLYGSIYDDSLWLINLVENLLAMTRIEEGSRLTNIQPELIDDVFREAIAHMDRKAEGHSVAVKLDNELLMAYMDGRLIVQVLINLLNNAVKYTPPDSHIELSARENGSLVTVRVADDGPGISDEAKAKIFDMFYTGNNARGDGRRGMGLGLALCRSIVAAHGGEICVEDNVPRGAAFVFSLPKAEVNTNEQT